MYKLTNDITDFFIKRNIISIDLKEVYRYGFELIISDMINFSMILMLSFLFRQIIWGITFLVCFSTLRSFCGGYHAKTYWQCRTTFVLLFVAVTTINYLVKPHGLTILMLDVISMLIIVHFAPIENKNKPLTEELKESGKDKSIVLAGIYTALSLFLNWQGRKEGTLIALTLLSVSILMLVEVIKKQERRCSA